MRQKSPTTTSKLLTLPSPVEPFRFAGQRYHVKRDDLIHPLFSGNKYRKLASLFKLPLSSIQTVHSYGGIQSNAMLSIAALCSLKGWQFHYTVKRVPKHVKARPAGNYRQALALGMILHEVVPDEYDNAVASLQAGCAMSSDRELLIPQGGASETAKEGIDALAQEIAAWQKVQGFEALSVVTPSGTGTTAAYLAAALPPCQVVTVAAVGTPEYLRAQISRLVKVPENLTILPTPYRFGTLYPELLQTYGLLKEGGIEFDLLYAPVMWRALLQITERLRGEVLYVHSGGVSGNETMLERYGFSYGLKH